MSACEGQKMVNLTVSTLQSIRKEQAFDLFWEHVESKRVQADVASPTLPRKRKVPQRYEIGDSNPEFSSTAKDYYRRVYFEAVDLCISSINNRFEQVGFQMLQKLERVLTTYPLSPDSELVKDVISFYGGDFHTQDRLVTQLHAMHAGNEIPLKDLSSVVSYLKSLSSTSQDYFSEVIKVVKLI